MRLLENIRRHALDLPDRVALRDMSEAVTYRELLERVVRMAEHIRQRDLRCVALVGDNVLSWVVFDLACLASDVTNVPVPAFFTPAQKQHLISQAGVEAVYDADRESWETVPAHPEPAFPPGTAKITFTSGSTGTPRGVCLSQRNMDATVEGLVAAIEPLAIREHLCVLPLATLLENVAGVYLPLWLGASVTVLPAASLGFADGVRFDPQQFFSALRVWLPDSLILVPQLLSGLVEAAESGVVVPPTLKLIAVGGGKVAPETLARAAALGLPVYEGYGLSECGSVMCLNVPGGNRIGSVGRPLGHAVLRIAPDGEIEARGDSVMLGYLGQPGPGARGWLRTGDLGYVDPDGFVHVSGRSKNLIITSWGRNISPEWVESELLAETDIMQAVVFGEAAQALQAVVCPTPDADARAVAAAIGRANARLPLYARVGSFVIAPSFSFRNGELTANGRPIRDVIRERHLDSSQGQSFLQHLQPEKENVE